MLPNFKSYAKSTLLPLCFRAIIAAVIHFTTDCFGEDNMSEYLVFVTTSVPKNANYLVPKHIASVDKVCSALVSCTKVVWKATRFSMRCSGKLEFYGLSEDQCKLVYDTKITEPVAMTTVFTLSSICSSYRGIGTSNPVHLSMNDGGLATQVGDDYVDCSGVKRIVCYLFNELDRLGSKLFGDLDSSMAALLRGDVYITVNDSDSHDEANFTFNRVSADGKTETVTSGSLNKKLEHDLAAIRSLGAFNSWITDYILYGKVIQAIHGLLASRRETENEQINRRNGNGGLKRKLRFYECFRSDCGTVPLCVLIRRKEKFSLQVDECLSVVHPQVTLHILLYSCLREGAAAGIKSSRHKKGKVHPDFRLMLFVGKDLMRERKGMGAENSNAHILAAVNALNKSKSSIEPFLQPFGVSSVRHFHNALMDHLMDKMKNLSGGTANSARKALAESGIQGHSSRTGAGYVDSGVTENDSLVINFSQMTDLVATGKGMTTDMKIPFSVRSHWERGETVKRIEFETLAKAMGFMLGDDLKAREAKAAVYLRSNVQLLAMALSQTSVDGLSWDDDIVKALAHVLAVDERPFGSTTDEGDFRNHLFALLGMGTGKTLIFSVVALLQQHFVQKSNTKVTIVLYPNKNLMLDAKAGLIKTGLNVVEGKDASELVKLVWSNTGTGVIVAVLDTFLRACMKLTNSLVHRGKVVRVVIDEAHEFTVQKLFRSVFNSATTHLAKLSVNFSLLSGTFSAPVQADVVEMLRINGERDKIKVVTSAKVGVEYGHIRFDLRKVTTMQAVFNGIVQRASASAAAKRPHLVAVVTTKHGEVIVAKLEKNGVKSILATSETRRERGLEGMMTAWNAGTGDTFVLVSTQPLNGLNHETLAEMDLCGSHCILTAFQSALRVARTKGSTGTARLWTWPDYIRDSFGDVFEDVHDIYVCRMESFVRLTTGNFCLRKVFALGSAEGTDDNSDEAIERMKGCPSFVTGGPLPCSVCCPEDIFLKRVTCDIAENNQAAAISPSPRRQATTRPFGDLGGAVVQTPSEVRSVVLTTSGLLGHGLLCFYCQGTSCLLGICQKLRRDVSYACFWCCGIIQHSGGVTSCPLKPTSFCSKICTKCFDVNCESLQSHTTSALDSRLRRSCANEHLTEAPMEAINKFALITTTVFDNYFRPHFLTFLKEYFRNAFDSFSNAGSTDCEAEFNWLFEPMGGQVGSDQHVWNFNLALLYRWNGFGGKYYNLVAEGASPKKPSRGSGVDAGDVDDVFEDNVGDVLTSDDIEEGESSGNDEDSLALGERTGVENGGPPRLNLAIQSPPRQPPRTTLSPSHNNARRNILPAPTPPVGRPPLPLARPHVQLALDCPPVRPIPINPYALLAQPPSINQFKPVRRTEQGNLPRSDVAVAPPAKPAERHYLYLSGGKGNYGDWECPDCKVNNFKKNLWCTRCKTRKPAWCKLSDDRIVPANDWLCSCKFFNFGKNLTCVSNAGKGGLPICGVERPIWNNVSGTNVV